MSQGIQVHGVSKRFGQTLALDDVSLDVRDNEFFALLGPSGSGKTTLLRVLAGFDVPDEGRVIVAGQDVTDMRPSRRPLNLMFQSYALFPHMTVAGNVAYGLEMEKRARDEIEARVCEVLDLVKLAGFADRKPDQLSGGQRQRVALARALVKRPKVLLLDEPLSALDKKIREEMQLELKRLQHEVGVTFLVVTHDQEEALVLADRIAVLDRGRLAQVGTPHDLYERPDSRFVADFVGSMNFLAGSRIPEGAEVPGIGRVRAQGEAGTSGDPVSLAVRPERVSLSASTPADGRNSARGTVSDIAYRGADLRVLVSIGNGRKTIMARIPAGAPEHATLAVGQDVYCVWSAEHTRILPPAPTGSNQEGEP